MGMSYGKKLKICLEDIVTVTFIVEMFIKIAPGYYASWTLTHPVMLSRCMMLLCFAMIHIGIISNMTVMKNQKQGLSGFKRLFEILLIKQRGNGSIYDMIAVYHFQLQATIMEIYGYDCVGADYFDKQYDWLIKWKEQCKAMDKL